MDFWKDVGKHARVGTMMAKESVKKRLESEQGMSYTKFPLMFLFCFCFCFCFCFFFLGFFLFSFISELKKKNPKRRRFNGSNGSH